MSRTMIMVGAESCMPCKMTKKVLAEYKNITYVDAHRDQKLAINLGITTIPVIIFNDNGVEYDRITGMANKAMIEEKLKG